MLNEFKEFEEYTCPLWTSDSTAPRLQFSLLQRNRGGLQHALTVIARHQLFHVYNYETIVNDEECDKVCKNVILDLKAWLGIKDGCEQTGCPFDGWFKTYYETNVSFLPESKVPSYDEYIVSKLDQYDKNAFAPLFYSGNKVNAFTFGSIIAEAINLGPLNKYYLVCKNNFSESLCERKKELGDLTKKKVAASPSKKADYFLKIMSAYLISKKHTTDAALEIYENIDEELFYPINKIDISNWMQYASYGTSSSNINYTYLDESKNHIDVFKTILIANSVNKMSVSQDYIKKYDFKLVPANDFIKEEGYTFFSDPGSGITSLFANREIVYPQ